MYRDNEAGRVGAVMAAKAAGDRAAQVKAAVEFWLVPPEQPGPDRNAHDVWRSLVDGNALEEGRAAALVPIREGRALRPHAYVDIVESIAHPTLLLELADLALAKQLPVIPYLATPCFALIDGGHEDALWKLLQRKDSELGATTDRWVLVAVILTTSRIGKRHDLERWFADFDKRPDVPMWIVAAYLCTRFQTGSTSGDLAPDAVTALASTRRDDTAGLLVGLQLARHLQRNELDAFCDLYAREKAALLWPMADRNPLVLYLNLCKHAKAVDVLDLTFDFSQYEAVSTGGLIRVAVSAQQVRPANWRVGLLLQEGNWVANIARIAGFFPRMRDLPKGDPAVIPLHREMQQAKASSVSGASVAWDKLVRTKLSFLRRLKMAFF